MALVTSHVLSCDLPEEVEINMPKFEVIDSPKINTPICNFLLKFLVAPESLNNANVCL